MHAVARKSVTVYLQKESPRENETSGPNGKQYHPQTVALIQATDYDVLYLPFAFVEPLANQVIKRLID